MARQRAQAYRSSELEELTRQMLYAPPDKRAEVVRLAERFHDELDPAKNYPIDFVVYRLTERRVPPRERVTLTGEALAPDLRLFIDALSRSIELPPEADDPGETTKELADRLGVSTKTVGRWRDAGLRWRWGVRGAGDKPTVLITQAALAHFEAQQGGRVGSASRFSRMSEAEKTRLIDRAQRLADATDAPPQAILDHLARRSGRSAEAIRLLIMHHDASHSGRAVFAERAGPLTTKQKRVIDRAYRTGVGVAAMCRRYRKTRSTIYRAIHEARAERVLAQPITFIDSPIFEREDADEVILRKIERKGRARKLDAALVEALPDTLRPFYVGAIDPSPVTRSLVVRYNYLKHQAKRLQIQIDQHGVRAVDLDAFDALWQRIEQTRGEVLVGLLPAVLSVVRRQLGTDGAAENSLLLSMLDRGNTVLIEEVERFDPARSHTLESVLNNRLLSALATPEILQHKVDTATLIHRLVQAGVSKSE